MSSILLDTHIRLIDCNEKNKFIDLSQKKNLLVKQKSNHLNISTDKKIKNKANYDNFSQSNSVKHRITQKEEKIVYSINPVTVKNSLNKTVISSKNILSPIKKSDKNSIPVYQLILRKNSNCSKKSIKNLKDSKLSNSISKNNFSKNNNKSSVISKENHFIKNSLRPLFLDKNHLNRVHVNRVSFNNSPVNVKERTDLLSSLLQEIAENNENIYLNNNNPKHSLIQHSVRLSPEQFAANVKSEEDLINIKKFFLDSSSNTHEKNLSDAIFSDPNLSDVTWKRMVKLNTASDTWRFSHQLYNRFQSLKETSELDKKFLLDYPESIVKIKGYVVDAPTKKDMLTQFKLAFPTLETRQLISTYANQELLSPAYTKMLTSTPEFFHYEPKNKCILYELTPTKSGLLKLSITHTAQLKFVNNNHEKKYLSFGLRASILLTTNRNPNIKYSYYFK